MPAMPNWWMPPAIGGSISAPPNQSLGTPKSNNPIPQNWMDVVNTALSGASSSPQVQPTAPLPFQPPDLSQWMLWKDLGKDMQDYLINSVKGGFAEGSFGNNPNQLVSWSMLGGKDKWGNTPQTISMGDWVRGGGGVGPMGTSVITPTSTKDQIGSEITRAKDWSKSVSKPAQGTNTSINSLLQRLIGGSASAPTTAQASPTPSWWKTGKSVYPWGRGSTF